MEQNGKNQYDLIDFQNYDELRHLFYQNNFEPSKVTTLDIKFQNMTDVPPQKCLKVLINLQSLDLSNNLIQIFTAKNFIDCCWLTELNLSNNKIENLNNIQQLGSLQKLEYLNFNGNPVTSYLTRSQIMRELLNPDKFKKYDPVQTLMSLYQNIPKQTFVKEKMQLQEKTREMIDKTEFETINQIKKDILNGQNKQPVKTRVIKYSIYPAPKNRIFRFSNLTTLNEIFISQLEVFQATGTSTLEEIIAEDPKVVQINEKNKQRQQFRLRPQTTMKKRTQSTQQNEQSLNKIKKKFDPDIKRDPQTYNQLVKNHHSRIDKELQKVFKNNSEHKQNDEDELKNFKVEPTKKFQILALADRFNPKRFTNDSQFKPEDLLYKNAQYEISIEDHKKMLLDYQNQKQKKILQQQQQKQKQNEKIQVKEKKKKLRQKIMFAGEHYKYEIYGEKEFDTVKNIISEQNKRKTKKMQSQADNQVKKSFSQKSNSLSENHSQTSNQKRYIDSDSQKEISDYENLEINYIKEVPVKKNKYQESDFIQNYTGNVVNLSNNKIQIFDEDKPDDIQKVYQYEIKANISIDDILPNNTEIISKEKEDMLKFTQNETYQTIVNAKNIIENSQNILAQTQNMDKKIKIQTTKHLNINFKYNTDYKKILEYLKDMDGNLEGYKDNQTSVLRELIYYINEYDAQNEPKMNEKRIDEYLKKKGITQKEANQLYKCLELIENQKIQNSKATLKRIEKKEVDRAEANATLASHYLKIKKYYPEGKFDKFMKNLYIDDFSDHFGGFLQKKDNQQHIFQKKYEKEKPYKEKGLDMKKLDQLKENKQFQIGENIFQKKNKDIIVDPALRTFEEQVDYYLRKMQHEMTKKNDKLGLTLEEKMIQMAQQLKENQKVKEQFILNIDQIRPDLKKKNEEFWEWVIQEHTKRYDKKYCFKEYVKQIRDGKKK